MGAAGRARASRSDFANMEQRNVATNIFRRIRRAGMEVPGKDMVWDPALVGERKTMFGDTWVD